MKLFIYLTLYYSIIEDSCDTAVCNHNFGHYYLGIPAKVTEQPVVCNEFVATSNIQ